MKKLVNYIQKVLYSFILFVVSVFSSNVKGQDFITPIPNPSIPSNVKQEPFSDPKVLIPSLSNRQEQDKRQITLEEAIEFLLQNNKDINLARQNVRTAELELKSAIGVYQSNFSINTQYERATFPNIGAFTNNKIVNFSTLTSNGSYQNFIPKFGTVLKVQFTNTYLTTDTSISFLTPRYNTDLTFSFVQPLFRGRKFDSQRRVIEIARRNISLTDIKFRIKTTQAIRNVQRVYWDLAYAIRCRQIYLDSLYKGRELNQKNNELLIKGQLDPLDISRVEAKILSLEESVYEANDLVIKSENELKYLIAANKDDKIWNVSLVPIAAADINAPTTALDNLLQLAKQNRPEIQLYNVDKEINKIENNYYSEQTKPQVDVFGSYKTAGIGSSYQSDLISPFVSTLCSSSYWAQCANYLQHPSPRQNLVLPSSTLIDLATQKYPIFRVGININFPLGNKTAKANLEKNLFESENLQTQTEQLEFQIQVEVRNAFENLRNAEGRIMAASRSRTYMEELFARESQKLETGESNTKQYLEFQADLMNARLVEVRAQRDLNRAWADLQAAIGRF